MKVPSVHSSAKAAGRPKATTGRIPVGIRSVVVKYTSSARGTGTSKPARSGFVAIKPFEVTRLRSLLKRRDYTSMMRKITPAFFRRGLRDVTARKSLLQLENALLREAQRLLNTGEYSQATKLLNKIVRLGGPLSSRAQSLKKAKTKAAVARRVFTKTRGSVKASGSAKVSARKARTKKAFKKNGGATRSPEPAPTKVAAPTGGVKRAAGRSGKRTAKSPKRAEGTSSAGPRLGPQAGPSAGPPPGPAPGSQSGRLPGSRRLSLAEDSAEMEYPAGLGAPDIRKIKGAEAPLGAPYIRNIEYEEAPETADVADDGGEAESAASEGDGSVGGERRSGEEKEQTEVLQRTPHMDLSTGESPLAPAAEFDVYVSVDSREARPGEETQELELEGPASQEEFPVEVTLVVSGHFEPVADGIRTMTVLRSGETAPVVFKVQCAKQFPAEKDAALSALFRYQGHAGGRVTRRFKVENGKLVLATPAAAEAAAAPAPIASKAKLAAVSGLEQYDLTINVIDTGENDSKHFRLIADSPPTGKHVDVLWTLGDKSDQIVRNYMVKFVAQGLKPTARLAEMKGAGAQLFEATPKEFRQMFWELIDSGKAPKTIMVISDEPYLPWELMVPRRMAGGKLESRSPLGVEFCVGRWIRPDNVSAPQQIHLDKTYVVAGQQEPEVCPARSGVCVFQFPSQRTNQSRRY